MIEILQPTDWAKPKGYANGVIASGHMIVLAGQIGWDADQRPVGADFISQFEQALRNIVALLAEAGAGPQHLVRLTWFVTDRQAYLSEAQAVGAIYRQVIGRWYPAMTVVEVKSLMEPWALVEVEATAVL